jgi:hypothetical protein
VKIPISPWTVTALQPFDGSAELHGIVRRSAALLNASTLRAAESGFSGVRVPVFSGACA